MVDLGGGKNNEQYEFNGNKLKMFTYIVSCFEFTIKESYQCSSQIYVIVKWVFRVIFLINLLYYNKLLK